MWNSTLLRWRVPDVILDFTFLVQLDLDTIWSGLFDLSFPSKNLDSNTNPSSTTPLFLLWAIPQSCPIKDNLECGNDDQVDLLQLERTFRPLRSIATANAEDRVIDGLCIMDDRSTKDWSLERIKGFSADETMDAFLGEEFLDSNCNGCPANVYRIVTHEPTADKQFAGCYGYLQSTYDGWDLFRWWQTEIDSSPTKWNRESGFQLDEIWRTKNEYGIRVLEKRHAVVLLELLKSIPNSHSPHADWSSLIAAIEYSISDNLLLQLHVVPEAQVVDRNWIVPQHCSDCVFPIADWNGHCPHCRTHNPPHSLRKRQLRGDRPYWPLIRFLGEAGTLEVANRYFTKTTQDTQPNVNG